MPARLLIAIFAALGTTCCPFDCLSHQADSAAFFVAWSNPNHGSAGGIAPLSPPREHDESGCICRGAYFVDAPAVVPLELTKWCPLMQARVRPVADRRA